MNTGIKFDIEMSEKSIEIHVNLHWNYQSCCRLLKNIKQI